MQTRGTSVLTASKDCTVAVSSIRSEVRVADFFSCPVSGGGSHACLRAGMRGTGSWFDLEYEP